MEKFNKIALGLATAAVIALPGMAQAAVIDGINVGTGVLTFVASTIMEERVGGGLITNPGDVLHGVGNVTEIRSDGVLVWTPSLTDELTFTFGNYTALNDSSTGAIGFSGGNVQFWHDFGASIIPANYSDATGFGADGAAQPWLDLVGALFNDPSHKQCTDVTLCGTGILTGTVDINGSGLLNVTGAGMADSYFNTNGTVANGHPNADFQLGSNANNQNPDGWLYGTHGTASISNIRTVPEPATVALMALGLLGIGFSSRKYGRTK